MELMIKMVSLRYPFLNISSLEDETTMLSQKIWNQIPSKVVSHPRRADASSTLLQGPKKSQDGFLVQNTVLGN